MPDPILTREEAIAWQNYLAENADRMNRGHRLAAFNRAAPTPPGLPFHTPGLPVTGDGNTLWQNRAQYDVGSGEQYQAPLGLNVSDPFSAPMPPAAQYSVPAESFGKKPMNFDLAPLLSDMERRKLVAPPELLQQLVDSLSAQGVQTSVQEMNDSLSRLSSTDRNRVFAGMQVASAQQQAASMPQDELQELIRSRSTPQENFEDKAFDRNLAGRSAALQPRRFGFRDRPTNEEFGQTMDRRMGYATRQSRLNRSSDPLNNRRYPVPDQAAQASVEEQPSFSERYAATREKFRERMAEAQQAQAQRMQQMVIARAQQARQIQAQQQAMAQQANMAREAASQATPFAGPIQQVVGAGIMGGGATNAGFGRAGATADPRVAALMRRREQQAAWEQGMRARLQQREALQQRQMAQLGYI